MSKRPTYRTEHIAVHCGGGLRHHSRQGLVRATGVLACLPACDGPWTAACRYDACSRLTSDFWLSHWRPAQALQAVRNVQVTLT